MAVTIQSNTRFSSVALLFGLSHCTGNGTCTVLGRLKDSTIVPENRLRMSTIVSKPCVKEDIDISVKARKNLKLIVSFHAASSNTSDS